MFDLSNVDLSKLDARQLMELDKLLTPKSTPFLDWVPTDKQRAALLMNDTLEMLYGGAVSGGKSVYQFMAAMQYVDTPGYAAILFRKTYADLALPGALMDMARKALSTYITTGIVHWNEKDKRFTFPSGATLSFGYLDHVNDMYRYQGSEFQYIGFDEVTHIDPRCYKYLFSRLRKSIDIDVPLRVRATANPGGEFGAFYKERFIDNLTDGRIFLAAGLRDNPHIDPEEYMKSLANLDPIEQQRLIEGDWQVQDKGDFFDADYFKICSWSDVPEGHRSYVRWWDLASSEVSKKNKEPDWSTSIRMFRVDGYYYIDHIFRMRAKPADVERAMGPIIANDPVGIVTLMEQEPGSSGAYTIDHFARGLYSGRNFTGVRSTGSKIDRAKPLAAACKTGLVHIIKSAGYLTEFIDEAMAFPVGVHDDMVDCVSGCFSHYANMPVIAAPSVARTKQTTKTSDIIYGRERNDTSRIPYSRQSSWSDRAAIFGRVSSRVLSSGAYLPTRW